MLPKICFLTDQHSSQCHLCSTAPLLVTILCISQDQLHYATVTNSSRSFDLAYHIKNLIFSLLRIALDSALCHFPHPSIQIKGLCRWSCVDH